MTLLPPMRGVRRPGKEEAIPELGFDYEHEAERQRVQEGGVEERGWRLEEEGSQGSGVAGVYC